MKTDIESTWWQQHQKAIWILILCLFFIGCLILVICSYIFQLSWTGFNASQGPNVLQYQSTKTLWDWLQLLFVPIALSLTAYWFNSANSQREQRSIAQRDKTERAIALDNQQATLLQDYLDRMSDLLLGQKFHDPQIANEARNISRAHTLTVLPHLNDERKGRLILFLYESQLLTSNKNTCISLRNADLSEADLSGFDLNGINLSGANLSGAKMSGVTLSDAQLQEAYLNKADLSGAILRSTNFFHANLSEAVLNGTQLQDAKLIQANLSHAQFAQADATRADFSDAIVSGLVIDHTIFDGAIINEALHKQIQQHNK